MWHLKRPPSYSILMFLCLVFVTAYSIYITIFPQYPFNVPRISVVDPIPTRRDLARKILKIQREIEFHSGLHNGVDASWAKELKAIISELDSRVEISDEVQKMPLRNAEKSESSKLPNVCPEIYKGEKYDKTHEHNFLELACESRQFKEVLTTVIIAREWTFRKLEFVIQKFRQHYDVNIIVLIFGSQLHSIKGVETKVFSSRTSEAEALNDVIYYITTPYIFLMHSSVSHFNDQSPLERPVRVLDKLDKVAVVSGAYRDLNGHWHHGCLQITAENYKLKYIRGYEHSSQECMYCDDVLGPFVVKTNDIKSIPMTVGLSGPTMYRDWFLKVRLNGKLVMSCPDVMFFVDAEQAMLEKEWRTIAGIWSFQYIVSFEGSDFEISCEDAGISCNHLKEAVSSFLIPPCCRKKQREDLAYFQDCAEKLGLRYELNGGTNLGAVKMDGMLPWDFDADIFTDCTEQHIWLDKGFQCLKEKGCYAKNKWRNYWMITCKIYYIDISCRYNRTFTLPKEYRKVPTQAEYDGRWTSVASNPGRTARNNYGPEYLKHAGHWRYYIAENSTAPNNDDPEVAGQWNPCIEPSFHACLDHFPVDGNLKFHQSGRSP